MKRAGAAAVVEGMGGGQGWRGQVGAQARGAKIASCRVRVMAEMRTNLKPAGRTLARDWALDLWFHVICE